VMVILSVGVRTAQGQRGTACFGEAPKPVTTPASVPPSTLTNAPAPMLRDPPFKAVMVLVAFRFNVPGA
jgi:hypothetical protein